MGAAGGEGVGDTHTWGNFSGIHAHAGPDRAIAHEDDTTAIGIMDQAAWTYEWTPSTALEDDEEAITRAWPSATTQYVLTLPIGAAVAGCSSWS